MSMNSNNDKLDWMYKGAHSQVDREEYLLGKSVDKTFEQLTNEEKEKKLGLVPPKNHVEHECIPPSIRDYNKIVHEEQVDLSAKLQEDPLVAIKRQEEEARRQFLQNPIQLKKLQEAMKSQENKKKSKKQKKKKHDSEDELDRQLAEKLKKLKGKSASKNLLKNNKKEEEDNIDIILMHKFNQLKDKLSQEDLNDILAGKSSDSEEENVKKSSKKHKQSSSSSNESEDEKFNDKKSRKRNSSKEYNRKKDNQDYNERRKDNYYEAKRTRRSVSRERGRKRDGSNSSDDNRGRYDSKIQSNSHKKYDRHRNIYSRSNKRRDSSASSNDSETRRKESRNKKYESRRNEKYRANDYNSKRRNYNRSSSEEEKEIPKSNKKDEDLDNLILEKLRKLRDSNKPQETETNITNVQQSSYYDSDNDEYVVKKESFGLVRTDGTKISLKKPTSPPRVIKPKIPEPSKPVNVAKKSTKKLSEKEKEELRMQMMSDAVERDKERSDNLKKHRLDNKQTEAKIEEFDSNFVHRELTKSQNNIKDVATKIRSNLNNIQRSTRHMNSNFSKR
ncbi:unnamed protein product [Phyllotreta striolata]|uniref:Pre-mRNA-splicing factor CWC25-like protein n=1 Tax=Phyllotreta striolata TaxID=444603 RepID=A0A9N9TA41_PHYSR|nr:unnamed protein product [Phyllotreta striolata]